MSGWDWFAMSAGSVLLCALLLTAAVLLIRNLSHSAFEHPRPTPASAAAPDRPGTRRAQRVRGRGPVGVSMGPSGPCGSAGGRTSLESSGAPLPSREGAWRGGP